MLTTHAVKILLVYILCVSIITFAAYGIDKRKAEKNKWRIPESVLIMLAVLGGSVGALAGMLVFHHKTKKAKFVIGIPVILLLQAAAALILLMYVGTR